jgi:hypothetical protein
LFVLTRVWGLGSSSSSLFRFGGSFCLSVTRLIRKGRKNKKLVLLDAASKSMCFRTWRRDRAEQANDVSGRFSCCTHTQADSRTRTEEKQARSFCLSIFLSTAPK